MSSAHYVYGPTSPLIGLAEAAGFAHPDWHRDALCKETPGVNFFPDRGYQSTGAEAKAVCGRCLCREECLAYAMADPAIVGIWGGTSFVERQKRRRRGGGRAG